MFRARFKPGDPVIYRVTKRSVHPGPRAEEVNPEPMGEGYVYEVDKFWVVVEVRPDGKLLLRTRRGKEHLLEVGDARLRHARWWERLLYRHKFPRLTAGDASLAG